MKSTYRILLIYQFLIIIIILSTFYYYYFYCSNKVNTQYLATMVGTPFSIEIENGDEDINLKFEESAVTNPQALKCAEASYDCDELNIYVFIEIYKKSDINKIFANKKNGYMKQYDVSSRDMDKTNNSFFMSIESGISRSWLCGAYKDYSYVEVDLSPDCNANNNMTKNIVSSVLNYMDKLTKVASQ